MTRWDSALEVFRHNPTDGSFAPPNYVKQSEALLYVAKLRKRTEGPLYVAELRSPCARAARARAKKSIFFNHGQCGTDDGMGHWGQFAI